MIQAPNGVYVQPEEVRHACTDHYNFSALMSLRSRDNIQAKCTELVVIRACIGPPLMYNDIYILIRRTMMHEQISEDRQTTSLLHTPFI